MIDAGGPANFLQGSAKAGEAAAAPGLPALAADVDLLGEYADSFLLFRAVGEREGIEAAGFGVAWSIFARAPGCKCIDDVNPNGQSAAMKGLRTGDDDHPVGW